MRIAMVTCESPPVPDEDAALLEPVLEELGVEVARPAWSDPGVEWGEFDRAWISSTWDYHRRLGEFRSWLGTAGEFTRVDNPAALIEWNLDKAYLRDLEAAGIPIVPTIWAGPDDDGETVPAAEAAGDAAARGWGDLVVKPSVDIGAFNLVRVGSDRLPTAIDGIGEACLVQPFLESIPSEGELSLVHYGGELSHTIRKLPADGDFRVQEQYGGRFAVAEPPAEATEIGRHALDLAAELHPDRVPPLYGRVDLVRGPDGELCVGEVELIEPALYLHHAEPEAVERFAALLVEGP